jgi:hypothetical protein
LLPLYLRHSGYGRSLASLGDGVACTDDFSVLAHEADASEVAITMGQYLASVASERVLGWDTLRLQGVYENDLAWRAFSRGLRGAGAMVHSCSRMNAWFKPCNTTWNEYLTSISKSSRRKYRQLEKTFESSPELSIDTPSSRESLTAGIEDLIQLHQRRWNVDGQSGTYASQSMRRFVHETAQAFLAQGRLYLPQLRQSEQTIATELHLLGNNKISYCYSSGYEIDQSDYQPGRLLNTQILKRGYELGLAGIEFMRGDETYKERIHAVPQRVIEVRAFAPAIIPRLKHVAWLTGFEMKQWIRKRTGRKHLDVVLN